MLTFLEVQTAFRTRRITSLIAKLYTSQTFILKTGLSQRSRIIIGCIWTLIPCLGIGVATKLTPVKAEFSFLATVALTGPSMMGVLSYLVAPYLATLPRKPVILSVLKIINTGLAVSTVAAMGVAFLFFILAIGVNLVSGFSGSSLLAFLIPVLIFFHPTFLLSIFGGGILSSALSFLYLRNFHDARTNWERTGAGG